MSFGFVDLRLNQASSSGADSFWPSFTDIMTVVVMIFLLASTVLIVNNQELVDNLRASILAQQQAAEIARTTSQEKQTVEEQLAQAQHELSVLRIEQLQSADADKLKTQLLAEKARQLDENRQDLEESRRLLQTSEAQVEQLNRKQAETAVRLLQQGSELQQTRKELAELNTTIDQQNKDLALLKKDSADLVKLRDQASLYEQSLGTLQEEYDVLKVKYDKLFQPARSAAGKQVVTVRYEKRGGSNRISYKSKESEEFEVLTAGALEQRLDNLKKEYPNRLYVKIVIPEDSGLSYTEAWGFTRSILDKYDYYYQQ